MRQHIRGYQDHAIAMVDLYASGKLSCMVTCSRCKYTRDYAIRLIKPSLKTPGSLPNTHVCLERIHA